MSIYPDAVMQPSNVSYEAAPEKPDWHLLSPCPQCNANPHDAPEGTNMRGEPFWVHAHCWKCGYRPGKNEATSLSELQRQFEAFKAFQETQTQHPTLQAPANDSEVEQLRAALAEAQAKIAAADTSVAVKPWLPGAMGSGS